MYLKFPMYLFFYVALGINDFWYRKKINYSGHWKGWALKISTFLGPNGTRFARCHFRAQESLDFQGPPLPMTLKIGSYRIWRITYRAIKTTGTLKSYYGAWHSRVSLRIRLCIVLYTLFHLIAMACTPMERSIHYYCKWLPGKLQVKQQCTERSLWWVESEFWEVLQYAMRPKIKIKDRFTDLSRDPLSSLP